MSNADAGGAAMNASIVSQDNTGSVSIDANAWMVMGSLASALEDLLDDQRLTDKMLGNYSYATNALEAYRALKGHGDQSLGEVVNFASTLGPLTLSVQAPEGDGQVHLSLAGHIAPVHIHIDRTEAREVFRALGEVL